MSATTLSAAPVSGAADEVVLVSHTLCPYVQRCAIVATEKAIPFQRRDVDLADKPDWFRALSPLGKVPLLMVPDHTEALFESDVICQYLDEISPRPLLAATPLARARQRASMAYASALLDDIARLYGAPQAEAMVASLGRIGERLMGLETSFGDGPWFDGARFGLVDAAFGPVFRYFDVLGPFLPRDVFDGLPRLGTWRVRLAARASVRDAVTPEYPHRLLRFVVARGGALGGLVEGH